MLAFLAEVESTGSQSQLVFDNIPAYDGDLFIQWELRSSHDSGGEDNLAVAFNDSTNISGLKYVPSQTIQTTNSISETMAVGTTNTFTFGVAHIYGYAASDKTKFFYSRSGNVEHSRIIALGGHWNSTSPITKIALSLDSAANFTQYSVARLYVITPQ